jgi:hypothetical protein
MQRVDLEYHLNNNNWKIKNLCSFVTLKINYFEIINLKTENFEEIYLQPSQLWVFFITCSVVDQLLTFTTQTRLLLKFHISSGTAVPIPTTDITTNSNAEFENNNTKANLVKDVRLKELTVTITDQNKTFSFLKSIRLYISTDANDEIELAYKDDINSNFKYFNTHWEKLDKYKSFLL